MFVLPTTPCFSHPTCLTRLTAEENCFSPSEITTYFNTLMPVIERIVIKPNKEQSSSSKRHFQKATEQ